MVPHCVNIEVAHKLTVAHYEGDGGGGSLYENQGLVKV